LIYFKKGEKKTKRYEKTDNKDSILIDVLGEKVQEKKQRK
jgi:hypothetical protein